MLQSLTIKNYAIIENVELILFPGLNIITGETGAGKSILIGALQLILGKRADTKVLFDETKKCIVEGVFDVSAYKLQSLIESLDLEYDDELINASQQIEEALNSISSYEDITNATNTNAQAIDLPIIQSPGGSLQLTNQSFKPQSLFNNCKFNGNVTIVLKQLMTFCVFKQSR